MPKQRTSAAIAALVKGARQASYPKGKVPMVNAMIEIIQIYWIDCDDGGIPPDCIQRAAQALADW